MDARIVNAARPDIVLVDSAPRPTPTPARVPFSQVLAAGVNGIVQGAEIVASRLPGSPITAAAVRGGSTALSGPTPPILPSLASAVAPTVSVGGVSLNAAAEGPAAVSSATVAVPAIGPSSAGASTDPSAGIDASLQQSAQMNLFYLQLQQQVDSQNRAFTTLSNVLKAEHDTAKSAIGNIHS